jgi:hypothetical protein
VRQRPVCHQQQGLDLSKRLSWRIGMPKRHDDEGGCTVLDRQRDRQINAAARLGRGAVLEREGGLAHTSHSGPWTWSAFSAVPI